MDGGAATTSRKIWARSRTAATLPCQGGVTTSIVMETSRGHYVGHSARVSVRAREHAEGSSPSTAGANPKLAWTSGPLKTRAAAARFEAAMKALRDQRADRFREITGLLPEPFVYPARRPYAAVPGRRAFWLVLAALLLWWLLGALTP